MLMALLDALPERLQGLLFLRLLCTILAAMAILIAATTSLKMGEVAGISAAAMLGCCILRLDFGQPTSTRGLIPAFVVVAVGLRITN